jgi:NitT/TauT family transport system substrate-binding protein
VNTPLLVGAGQLDLAIGTGFTTLNMVAEGIAGVTVAAFFQKDPQTLVAHPDQGIASLADVKDGRSCSAKARQKF